MKKLQTSLHILFLGVLIFSVLPMFGSDKKMKRLDNPITVPYLEKKLRKSQPRLVLNADLLKQLKAKIKTDPVLKNMFAALKLNAADIQKKKLLKREKIGRRLLRVSREALYRINMLGMVYAIEQDPKILQRINDEVVAVCKFSDWNPSHFLDTAEMSLAVALALDWTAGALPKETIELAQNALIDKGIQAANTKGKWLFQGNNNWNQVCNGGMIAAALTIAEKDPELAAKTIHRSLDGIPYALVEYMPDGVYPEGATYWGYGTSYTVITIAMLRSALGTDFGIAQYPGFLKSATFRTLACAPSDHYFNFADCGTKRLQRGDDILAWFATETGNKAFFEKDRFLMPPEKMGKLNRFGGASLVWLSQFKEKENIAMPTAWSGKGANPVVFFTGGEDDPHQYYFGGKGGRGTVNHGNMDAGSFIFELNGVRWAIDPGNQSYHELEKTGFKLWGRKQNSPRWQLLTKNNFGHNTLTVNDRLHVVDGMAKITSFKTEPKPSATIDLTPVFAGKLKKAKRKFTKDSPVSILIEDTIELLPTTKKVVWQVMTTANVKITEGGAILSQKGKKLKLENLSHPEIPFKVVSLNPPPHKLDIKMKNLQRIELKITPKYWPAGKAKIKIRLAGTDAAKK